MFFRFIRTYKKSAFTLTETLIALTVLGIVAAITIPSLNYLIQNKVRQNQVDVAKTKFTKAMEAMAQNNKVGPYYENTEEFVKELLNYLKISRICDKNHLQECFNYDKITMPDGTEYELSNMKNGKVFGMPKTDTSDFEGDTMGIVTLDGTPMVIAWNKKCPALEPGTYKWGKESRTNVSTSCTAIAMDINNDAKPNVYNKDFVLFNALQLNTNDKSGCGMNFEYNNQEFCWSAPIALTEGLQDCESKKDALGIKNCYTGSGQDYWGRAVEICGGVQNMPTVEELYSFANLVYDRTDINSMHDYDDPSMQINATTLAEISPVLPVEEFSIFTGTEESANSAKVAHFNSNALYWASNNTWSKRDLEAVWYAFCVSH